MRQIRRREYYSRRVKKDFVQPNYGDIPTVVKRLKSKGDPLTPIAENETQEMLDRMRRSRERRERDQKNKPNWDMDVLHEIMSPKGERKTKKKYVK